MCGLGDKWMNKYSMSVSCNCPFKTQAEKYPFSAHLSGILPLCGLGDMVHEVDLSVGGLRHLPARGQVICDVIALLTQVLQLVALKNEK